MWWKRNKRRVPSTQAAGRHALLPIPLAGGLLSGEIRNEDGRPIPGAEISVIDDSDRRVAHSDTDAFGLFTAAVLPGRYRVRADAGGYRGLLETAEVEWGAHEQLGRLVLATDETASVPPPGVYEIDPAHSTVGFTARHIAMSRIYGQFREFTGRIRIAEPFEESRVEVDIDAASVFTNNADRDTHLRSADFLDVERYPRMYFTSSRFRRPGGNRWLVDGELSLHGMTSDVQLDTTYLGIQDWNGIRAGITATAELHREHFTVNWQQMLARGVPVVGSTVQIHLDVQAALQSD